MILLIIVVNALSACMPESGKESEPRYLVPLVLLIVDPESRVDTRVATSGYLSSVSGRPMLFLTREHEWIDDMSSAIQIRSEDIQDCLGAHAEVYGTVRKRLDVGDFVIADVERVVRIDADREVEVCFSAESA
jgi:hypothetical protein